jgi:alpha-tubulin suppressor-like RCC1 family protein
LFVVGNNEYGCYGDGTINAYSTIKQIEYFLNIFIVDVSCGYNHCLSISNKGEIYGWGGNKFGQLGNGISGCGKLGEEKQLTPIKIFKI